MKNEVFTVTLPDIGEGVVEGEVIEWLKQVGDEVNQDEPVVIVMTDKVTVELPAPHPGVIAKQYYRTGEISIKGQPLYDIQLKESQQVLKQHKEMVVKQSKVFEYTEKDHDIETQDSGGILALPKVRHLAKELGIDLSGVEGSGKGGRIEVSDLRRCIHGSLPVHVELPRFDDDEELPLSGIRGLMAKKMTEAHAQIPQFSYFEWVEATQLIQLRENFLPKAASEGIALSYMPFFIKALSICIKQYPLINSAVDRTGGKVIVRKPHNIGIAMATENGLIVPVLKNVQQMNLEEVIKAYAQLKSKATSGRLLPEDMRDATITLTNFGVFDGGGLWATPIINYPEASILGVARIRKEAVVRNQEIAIRDMLPLSWSFDHRIIDGELAVKVSHHYGSLLRNPAALL